MSDVKSQANQTPAGENPGSTKATTEILDGAAASNFPNSENEKTPIADRLYVGNIDFHVDESQFRQFLTERGIEHVSVVLPSKIITRRKNKSYQKFLGFGFIQFASEEDANSAMEKLNGAELNSRYIYFKKAVPPATEEERKKKIEEYFAQRKEYKKQQKAKKKEMLAEKARAHKAKTGDGEGNLDAGDAGSAQNGETEGTESKATGPKGSGLEKKAPEGKKKKQSIRDTDKKPANSVFVTNVDYHATPDTLGEFLKSLDLSYTRIHIPKRIVPPALYKMLQRKGVEILNRGIAFVVFPDPESQSQAVAKLHGTKFEDRILGAEIAVTIDKPTNKKNARAEYRESGRSRESGEAGSVSTEPRSTEDVATPGETPSERGAGRDSEGV